MTKTIKFKNLSVLSATLLFTSNLLAQDITLNQAEVLSYSAQKHRVDFNAQTDKSKADIIKEYSQTSKLADTMVDELKDDANFKVTVKLVALEIWASKFMSSINPTEDELKKLYDIEKPKINSRYNLRNILLKDEVTADKLLKTISTIKDKTKKLTKFKELASSESLDITTKSKEGAIGFIDEVKFDKQVQQLLKGKNKGDIIKLNMQNIGWQLFYIEEYQATRDASPEEAKQFLTNILRQKALNTEIERRLQK
jgi:parvulin-like peptidyl-prolyl isomerase